MRFFKRFFFLVIVHQIKSAWVISPSAFTVDYDFRGCLKFDFPVSLDDKQLKERANYIN